MLLLVCLGSHVSSLSTEGKKGGDCVTACDDQAISLPLHPAGMNLALCGINKNM